MFDSSPVHILLGIGVLVAVILIKARQDQKLFNEKFPAISDDEFVGRCGLGTNPEIS